MPALQLLCNSSVHDVAGSTLYNICVQCGYNRVIHQVLLVVRSGPPWETSVITQALRVSLSSQRPRHVLPQMALVRGVLACAVSIWHQESIDIWVVKNIRRANGYIFRSELAGDRGSSNGGSQLEGWVHPGDCGQWAAASLPYIADHLLLCQMWWREDLYWISSFITAIGQTQSPKHCVVKGYVCSIGWQKEGRLKRLLMLNKTQ